MTSNDFDSRYEHGLEAEKQAIKYLQRQGYFVLHTAGLDGKMPLAHHNNETYYPPDILAFKNRNRSLWADVKRRTPTWFRMKDCPVVMLEERYIQNYIEIQELSGIACYVFFVVDGTEMDGHSIPGGVYANAVDWLLRNPVWRGSATIEGTTRAILNWDITRLMEIVNVNDFWML